MTGGSHSGVVEFPGLLECDAVTPAPDLSKGPTPPHQGQAVLGVLDPEYWATTILRNVKNASPNDIASLQTYLTLL